jgi:hypothetical protein
VQRTLACLSLLLCCACGGPEALPTPHILSVEPEQLATDVATPVVLTLDTEVLPFYVDYGAPEGTQAVQLALSIGGREVTIDSYEREGRLHATVPAGLPEGAQELRVSLPDGREALSQAGLLVLPPPPELSMSTSGGKLTGIQIETIPDQVRGVPFRVVLRMVGPGAPLFSGQVQLTTNKGRLGSNLSGAFSSGVREELLTLDRASDNVVLTVRAGKNLRARSNAFKVLPP